jgi:hypothetical protein
MYTLYQITPPHMASTKIKEMDSLGELRKYMNSMKMANKAAIFGIWNDTGHLMTSMLNK